MQLCGIIFTFTFAFTAILGLTGGFFIRYLSIILHSSFAHRTVVLTCANLLPLISLWPSACLNIPYILQSSIYALDPSLIPMCMWRWVYRLLCFGGVDGLYIVFGCHLRLWLWPRDINNVSVRLDLLRAVRVWCTILQSGNELIKRNNRQSTNEQVMLGLSSSGS